MSAVLIAICAGVVMGCAGPQETPRGDAELWSEIRSLLEKSGSTRDPQFVNYLKSLTPEQMVAAARQACKEPAADVRLVSDELRFQVAVEGALVCLEYCFENGNADEVGQMLLKRASDQREHPYLRFAIVGCTSGYSRHRFGKGLRAYTMDKWREVDKVITNMLTAGQENPYLRSQTIESLAGVLRDQFWSACESDPNIRRALKDAEKHGSEIVQIIQLAQSGEVELDETTWETLRPVLLRIDESIRLLGAIALDTEREAEAVREQARRTLERYRMLRVLRLDQKIDKALEQVGD